MKKFNDTVLAILILIAGSISILIVFSLISEKIHESLLILISIGAYSASFIVFVWYGVNKIHDSKLLN